MSDACKHKRGDFIQEKGFWLCADCFSRLDARPQKFGSPTGLGRWGPLQIVLWQAEIATAECGMTLNRFLRVMVRRIMARTRPIMEKGEAYDAAIGMLKDWPGPFGHPDYFWSDVAAREMVDEEMQNWEEEAGNE